MTCVMTILDLVRMTVGVQLLAMAMLDVVSAVSIYTVLIQLMILLYNKNLSNQVPIIKTCTLSLH